jgi:hypothetical protein
MKMVADLIQSKFIADLTAARDAAIAECVDVDTDGTCNLDQTSVAVGPDYSFKKKSQKLIDELKAAGFFATYDGYLKEYRMTFCGIGHGFQRTATAERVRDRMLALGWKEVGVAYIVD